MSKPIHEKKKHKEEAIHLSEVHKKAQICESNKCCFFFKQNLNLQTNIFDEDKHMVDLLNNFIKCGLTLTRLSELSGLS